MKGEYQLIMSKLLHEEQEKPAKKDRKRSLSSGVVSRWYRPPEIIVAERNYDFAVDIWSLGVMLAELIHCSEPYTSNLGT